MQRIYKDQMTAEPYVTLYLAYLPNQHALFRHLPPDCLAGSGWAQDRAATPPVLRTPAGPDFIYAWAPVRGGAGPARFLAGYMPWGYWGYSVLAKGAEPVELSKAVLGALALGPGALPGIVAATPRIPSPRARTRRLRLAALAGRPTALPRAAALVGPLAVLAGMALVYRGNDMLDDNRQVAVKVFRHDKIEHHGVERMLAADRADLAG